MPIFLFFSADNVLYCRGRLLVFVSYGNIELFIRPNNEDLSVQSRSQPALFVVLALRTLQYEAIFSAQRADLHKLSGETITDLSLVAP